MIFLGLCMARHCRRRAAPRARAGLELNRAEPKSAIHPPACGSRHRDAHVLFTRSTMYITDARHFLDEKGAIAPQRGPAKAMAAFHAGAIAYATDFDDTGLVA